MTISGSGGFLKKAADLARRPFRLAGRALRGEPLFVHVRSKEDWDEDYRSGRWEHLARDYRFLGNMALINHLLAFATDASQRRLLDVGCGDGALLAGLESSAKKFEYTGIDVSSEALETLRRRHPGAATVCADMARADAVSGVFDVLVFSECLYYADTAAVLAAYRAKAAPGALVIVSMHDAASRAILWARVASALTEIRSFTVRDDASGTAWVVKLLRYS